jgi:hypothetical protein
MVDVIREKYLRMMIDIEGFEKELEACKAYGAPEAEIRQLTEAVIDKCNELQRVSDGCGLKYYK